jgi:nucleoid-associated protein YgaU
MSNDIKVALVLGVGLVTLSALVFYRKDLAAGRSASHTGAATASYAGSAPAFQAPAVSQTPAPSPPARKNPGRAGHQHTVQPGDTLVGLAQRFYGDGDRFVEIYNANRSCLKCVDPLPYGTVLTIPDPEERPPVRSSRR